MVRRLSRLALWALLAVLLTGLGPPSVEAQFPQTCSSNRCIIDMSSSTYVIDNQWDIGTASGTQSITVNSSTSWSTTWNWTRPEEWNVTTYAAAITGWHWGWHFPAAQTGLPLQLSAGQSVQLDSAFTVQLVPGTPVQRYDVAYDIWFHPTATPKADGSDRYELMIWVAYSRDLWGSPSQVPIATPVIGGQRWKVFTDYIVNGAPHYVAFVVDGPDLTGVSLDLKDFTDWLLANQVMVQPSWYLTSVEFGPEIYKGRGTLNVSSYAVTVGSGAPPSPPPPPPVPAFTVGATTVSPVTIAAGQGATITTQVTAAAAASNMIVDLEIYNSVNTKIAGQIYTGQSFASGQTRSFTWSWPGTSIQGSYMVKVGVFSGDWTTLYTWDNDAAPFSVAAPAQGDLVITAVTAPASAVVGSAITIGDTTKNQGNASAGLASTGFYLTTKTFYDGTAKDLGKRSVGTLAAGASNSGILTVTIPAGTAPGNYNVLAYADDQGVVAESIEGNNQTVKPIQVLAAPMPDLRISTLTAPETAAAGSTITVGDTTQNQGSGSAGATVTGFYLTTKTFYDGTAQVLGKRSVGALAAGSGNSGTLTVTIPTGSTPGTYNVLAYADDQGVVSEGSEGNNQAIKSIQVTAPPPPPSPAPSFSIDATTVSPASVAAGQGATITTQITAATAASNTLVDLAIYNAGNTKIAGQTFSGQSFSGGQTRSFSWSWPGTSIEGAYMVKVRVSSGDGATLFAWDEDAAPFSVTAVPAPPFTVTSTTASPDPIARGKMLTIKTSVRGTLVQAGVQLDVEVYSATGVKVGQKFCTVSFAAGQTQSCIYKFLVPKTLPIGVYTVSVGVLNTDKTHLYTWVSTADTFTVN